MFIKCTEDVLVMGKEAVQIRIELDHRDDAELREWAKKSERSKRLQARHILRKTIRAYKENPEQLRLMGISQ